MLGSTDDLRRQNRDLVIKQLIQNGPMSRLQLSKATGLTGAAISRITRELIDVKLLREGDPIKNKKRAGRREIKLELDGSGAYVLAITVTANRKSVSLANAIGDPIDFVDMDDLNMIDPEIALQTIGNAALAMVDKNKIDRSRLLGAGVVIAVNIDPGEDSVMTSIPLGWKDVPIGRYLRKILKMPIKVEARAAALLRAELRNTQNENVQNIFLINVGLGIGSGAFINGKFLSMDLGHIGQIAHMRLLGNETLCRCGRTGCLEAVASGYAVLRKLQQHTDIPIGSLNSHLTMAVDQARAKNKRAIKAFHESGQFLGHGIDAVISLFNPDKILLAGETGRQPDFFSGVQKTLEKVRPALNGCVIETSSIRSNEAAMQVGLEAFVYTSKLDISQFNIE